MRYNIVNWVYSKKQSYIFQMVWHNLQLEKFGKFLYFKFSKISITGQPQRTKIVPPPASLTSDMQDRKASAADVELQILSPIRNIHAISPDENSQASPVRLKRYEGFEHGLNVMGRSRGNGSTVPPPNLRNKSPPVKKSKRKESMIDFGPPPTPNEKKSSSESNDRFIFLGNYTFFKDPYC